MKKDRVHCVWGVWVTWEDGRESWGWHQGEYIEDTYLPFAFTRLKKETKDLCAKYKASPLVKSAVPRKTHLDLGASL